jgi:hypothetical protein
VCVHIILVSFRSVCSRIFTTIVDLEKTNHIFAPVSPMTELLSGLGVLIET